MKQIVVAINATSGEASWEDARNCYLYNLSDDLYDLLVNEEIGLAATEICDCEEGCVVDLVEEKKPTEEEIQKARALKEVLYRSVGGPK